MAIVTRIYAAATCSWIDPATGLPEVDNNPFKGPAVARASLTGNQGFRFCNFAEATMTMDDSTNVVMSQSFGGQSGIYRGPSFAHLPSHAFPILRDIAAGPDAVVFTQIAGARTVSPEVIGTGGGVVGGAIAGGVIGSFIPVVGTAIGAGVGAIVGGLAGEAIAHQAIGFPPIWTKIQITLFKDGRVEAKLSMHSIFPSNTYYEADARPDGTLDGNFHRVDHPRGTAFYDATKAVQLPDWQNRGWGALMPTGSPGATPGNPWGIAKGVFGAGEITPN